MPYETHGLRHDTDALFAKLLAEDKWLMTPCVVMDDGAYGEDDETYLARSAAELLAFRDDCQVICGWPGARRQDVFEFTVGAFRSAVAGRSHNPQEEVSMTLTIARTQSGECYAVSLEDGGERLVGTVSPMAREIVEKLAKAAGVTVIEGQPVIEAQPEGECATPCEKAAEPAAQPTEDAAE